MGLISGNVFFHAELSFLLTQRPAEREGKKEVMTAGAAVTIVVASDSSIGPGLAIVCDFVVQE